MITDGPQPHEVDIYVRDVYSFAMKLIALHDRLSERKEVSPDKVSSWWVQIVVNEGIRSQIETLAPGYCDAYVCLAGAAKRRTDDPSSPLTSTELARLEVLRDATRSLLSRIIEARRLAGGNRTQKVPEPLDWHADPGREDEAALREMRWRQKLAG